MMVAVYVLAAWMSLAVLAGLIMGRMIAFGTGEPRPARGAEVQRESNTSSRPA